MWFLSEGALGPATSGSAAAKGPGATERSFEAPAAARTSSSADTTTTSCADGNSGASCDAAPVGKESAWAAALDDCGASCVEVGMLGCSSSEWPDMFEDSEAESPCRNTSAKASASQSREMSFLLRLVPASSAARGANKECQRASALFRFLPRASSMGSVGPFFLNRNAETLGMLGPSPKPEGLNPRA